MKIHSIKLYFTSISLLQYEGFTKMFTNWYQLKSLIIFKHNFWIQYCEYTMRAVKYFDPILK